MDDGYGPWFDEIQTAKLAVWQAEQQLRDTIDAARAQGAPWTGIGAALQISKQAAQQRFGHR